MGLKNWNNKTKNLRILLEVQYVIILTESIDSTLSTLFIDEFESIIWCNNGQEYPTFNNMNIFENSYRIFIKWYEKTPYSRTTRYYFVNAPRHHSLLSYEWIKEPVYSSSMLYVHWLKLYSFINGYWFSILWWNDCWQLKIIQT